MIPLGFDSLMLIWPKTYCNFTPAEHVSWTLSQISAWIIRAILMADLQLILFSVTSRYASSIPNWFHNVCIMIEYFPYLFGNLAVFMMVARLKDGLRAKFIRFLCTHC